MESISPGDDDPSDDDSYSQPDNPQSESESESPLIDLVISDADEENFRRIPGDPNTPDLDGPADSGVDNCGDKDEEEWENIDPRLRPVNLKRQRASGVG